MPETSFPKDKINVLLLENIHADTKEIFAELGYHQVNILPQALTESELLKALRDVHILGIRSKTHLTENIFQHAPKLLAAGCFCIGTNQVEMSAAAFNGIPIFNAPYSNTRSVAELVIGAAIMLIRRILPKNKAAHQAIWNKESASAYELRGKKMGIIGYGNIGSQVGILAEALGMQVLYFDVLKKLPLGNAKPCNRLNDLLEQSDIITLHLPEMPGQQAILNADTIPHIKKGACVINYARGSVVELATLKTAYDSGAISGVALDVFPVEPEKNGQPFECPFIGSDNVLLTPHIGGSTEEAQSNIAHDVAFKLLQFLETGNTIGSQSIPELSLPVQSGMHRILHIHQNIPGVLGEINSTLSQANINIAGQYLKTNEAIGYVVLDVNDALSNDATNILKQVKGTIKTRLLY